jgi:hypothetical protein
MTPFLTEIARMLVAAWQFHLANLDQGVGRHLGVVSFFVRRTDSTLCVCHTRRKGTAGTFVLTWGARSAARLTRPKSTREKGRCPAVTGWVVDSKKDSRRTKHERKPFIRLSMQAWPAVWQIVQMIKGVLCLLQQPVTRVTHFIQYSFHCQSAFGSFR